jgi:hypothetical protein
MSWRLWGTASGTAGVAASRNPASRHTNACQAVSPAYRHATRTTMPAMATSGTEIVTGSPPVIPGAAAAPAGSVAALTAHRRSVLRHGAAVTPALTQDDRRGTQRGRHLLPRPGESGPRPDCCRCGGGPRPRAPGRRGPPPTRGQIAALSAAASVRLIRRSSRLTARRTIASTTTTTATARPAAAIRTRGQGHRASLPPTAAAEPPNLMRRTLRA